jgi:integrase
MPHETASDVLPIASDVLPDRELDGSSKSRVGSPAAERSSASISITKASLRRLICPKGKAEAFSWDDQLPGLGLRAYASGKRVWLLQYRDTNGRTRRIRLGDVNALDPEKAREAARSHLVQKAIGNDPAAKRKAERQAARIIDLVAAYLDHQKQRARRSTLDQCRRNLDKYAAPLHSEALIRVDRATIHRLHKRLTATAGPVQANRTLATLSAMFSWGMRAGLAKENPAAFVPKNPEAPKTRVLAEEELRLIWQATRTGSDHDRIVRLLMLTGCRRDEIGSLRWSEISTSAISLPENRTKTGIVHEVPLPQLALEQLPARREAHAYVFGQGQDGYSGWSRSKARLDARIAHLRQTAGQSVSADGEDIINYSIPAWGLHDFRRTLSTRLNEVGTDPHVVEALLGHAGAKRGIAGVYNRASYFRQKTEALKVWSAIVAAVIADISP